jgi:hypothetical protein
MRGQAPNHPVLRWLKTVVVSDREKARFDVLGGDQEGVPEPLVRKPRVSVAVDASKFGDGIKTEGPLILLGMSLAGARLLARRCPAWRRREPGLLLLHGT